MVMVKDILHASAESNWNYLFSCLLRSIYIILEKERYLALLAYNS